jgi:hypothetical protein
VADGEWTSQAFNAQSGAFSVELSATPSESPIDAVIGLSAGAASWFPQLAAIVRFNPDGAIDVRAGSDYQADVSFPYTAGTQYRFHLDVNVALHSYAVAVRNSLGGWTWLARGVPFRTEQAQVAQLDNVATQVDSSSGAIEVCDVRVTPVDTSGCPAAVAGGGFITQAFEGGQAVVSADLVGVPDQVVDGVAGLSPRAATRFDDLAAAVRFSPEGRLEARNAGAYQADVDLPYFPGASRRIRIIADNLTHTYSVYAALGDRDSVQLAKRYAFRTSQSNAPFLANLNAIIDSPAGRLAMCNVRLRNSVGLRMSREGNYAVAPVPGSSDIIASDGATTLRLTSFGRTLAQLAAGGLVAVDPAGNVYVTRASDGNLVVEAYATNFTPRWTRSLSIDSDEQVIAIGADAASVVVGVGGTRGGVHLVKRWLVDGTDSTLLTVEAQGDVIAIGRGAFAVAIGRHNSVAVTKFSFGQSVPDWRRVWANNAQTDAIAIAANGRVYFGGKFAGPINFGGPTLQPTGNVYVVGLSSAGDHLYTSGTRQTSMRSMASNGTITAISGSSGGFRELVNLDQDGLVIFGEEGDTTFGDSGAPGTVVMGASNRVYWNFTFSWPTAAAPAYPYLIAIDPGV